MNGCDSKTFATEKLETFRCLVYLERVTKGFSSLLQLPFYSQFS